MGYHKQQYIAQCELDHFIDCAKDGTLSEEFPSLQGTSTIRHMPIDTRGNFEDIRGSLYDYDDVNIFVPDECWAMTQPIVEPKPAACPTTRPANDDQDVGYHGLKMSDL